MRQLVPIFLLMATFTTAACAQDSAAPQLSPTTQSRSGDYGYGGRAELVVNGFGLFGNGTSGHAINQQETQSAVLAQAPAPGSESWQDSTPEATEAAASVENEDQPKISAHEKAKQELHQEEKQRILGVVPNFKTSNVPDAAPLSSGQKLQLTFHLALDPFQFVAAALDAGHSQWRNDFSGFGRGGAGYARRFGAAYADQASGAFWGNFVFPSLLHEDPRYFREGKGAFKHRFLYALATTFWTKNDNGTWGFNYANVLGNLTAGGLSNVYYPASDRGAVLTFERAATVTAEGAIGSLFVEFWPDISQKVFHRKPNP